MLNVNVLAKSALAILAAAVLLGMFNATALGNEVMLEQVMSLFKMVLVVIVLITALINAPRILSAMS